MCSLLAGKKILIGGGTGFIGRNLRHLLNLKGYEYIIISRMPGPQHMSWQELQKSGIPRNTYAILNLAGQNVLDITQRWTPGFKQNIWNSRVNTNCLINELIQKSEHRPNLFLTMSGVGIYEPSPDKEYTEDTAPLRAYDYLSEMCHAWENAAKLPLDVTDVRQVTIRSGVVLGRDGGMIKQLYWPFFLGLGGPVLPGEQYLPWIHVQDMARLIIYVIENSLIKGVLNGVAPQVVTNQQFTEAFASALGRPAFLPVPKFMLDLLLDHERANMLTTGQMVIPKRTQSLGFDYIFPTIKEACIGALEAPAKAVF